MHTLLTTSTITRWFNLCPGETGRRPTRQSRRLGSREVFTFQPVAAGRILCVEGRLWITGGNRDIVLTAGQSHGFDHGGRWVTEALEPTVMEITTR